jgi:opacity protein-like surface antigen
MKRIRQAVAVVVIALLGACAATRAPVSEIVAAEVAVRDAEQAGAGLYSSLDLQTARYKLQDSKRAVEDDDNVRARRLAEESQIDARLAETKAQLGKANATIEQLRLNSAHSGRTAAENY